MPIHHCPINTEEHAGRLLAYCAGRLSGDAAVQLERHMAECGACAASRRSQSAVWQALDSWETPPVSADFNRRLYARIEAANAQPWYLRWLDVFAPVFRQPALPLGAAAIVIVTGFLLDHPARVSVPPRSPAASERSSVSGTEAEQMEKTLDDLEMLHQFDPGAEQHGESKEKSSKSM